MDEVIDLLPSSNPVLHYAIALLQKEICTPEIIDYKREQKEVRFVPYKKMSGPTVVRGQQNRIYFLPVAA